MHPWINRAEHLPQYDPTHGAKIATCSYCGSYAALVLKGHQRHELACSRCGAPLHDLKQMPVRELHFGTGKLPKVKKRMPPPKFDTREDILKNRPVKKRKKKSIGRMALEEIFDVIEDIFD